jgi:hypothetical protein
MEGKVFSSLSSEDKLLSDVIGNDEGSCVEDRLEQEAEASAQWTGDRTTMK